MFPTLHTFIHFRIVSSHVSRSFSAPPVLTAKEAKAPCVAAPRKPPKRKRKQKRDEDDIALLEFAREKIREQWKHLAAKACTHSQQEANREIDVRHHQLTLPTETFLDLAFYAFKKDSASTLLKLFQAGVLTQPTDDEIYVCCSRRQLQPQHGNPIRKVIEEGKKVLEVARKGHFAVVFNNDVMVFLPWNPEMTVSSVIQMIMRVVCARSGGSAMAMHRNTVLKEGRLCDLGLKAGSTLAVIPF